MKRYSTAEKMLVGAGIAFVLVFFAPMYFSFYPPFLLLLQVPVLLLLGLTIYLAARRKWSGVVVSFGLLVGVWYFSGSILAPALGHYFGTPDSAASGRDKSSPISRAEALKIAIAKLRAEGSVRGSNYRVESSREDGMWRFYFVFLPAAPDHDAWVLVADDGTIRY